MPTRILALLLSLTLTLAACAPEAPTAGIPSPTVAATPVATPTNAASSAITQPSATADRLAPVETARPSTADQSRDTSSGAVQAAAEVSGELAFQHVEALASQLGSRPVGTEAADEARDYIAAQLRSYGYQVEAPSFSFRQTDDRGSAVRWDGESIPAYVLAGSSPGQVRGEMVVAGIGRPSDFPAGGLAGRIALVERGTLTFQEKAVNATRAGASALIIYNHQAGNFRGTLTDAPAIPVVSISAEDGSRLRALAEQGLTVEVLAEIQEAEVPAYNVVGTLPGADDRIVVLGAHYDSVAAGPGANDNASGVATMLELARVLASRQLPFTVKVVAFGAEEVGLVGSRAYVASLSADERQRIVAMLNFDMVGVGDEARVGGDDALGQRAIRIGQSLGISMRRLSGRVGSSSDHASFIAAGIPSVFFYWMDDPNYHSANDRAEHVAPDKLAATAQIALRLLEELAQTGR